MFSLVFLLVSLGLVRLGRWLQHITGAMWCTLIIVERGVDCRNGSVLAVSYLLLIEHLSGRSKLVNSLRINAIYPALVQEDAEYDVCKTKNRPQHKLL